MKDTDACTIADQGDLPGVRTIYASALQQKSSKMMQRSSQGGARSDSPVDIASPPNFSYRLPSPIDFRFDQIKISCLFVNNKSCPLVYTEVQKHRTLQKPP